MWFFGRGEVSLRPFSFDRKLFAKIAGSKRSGAQPFAPRLYFASRKRISAKSPAAHRKKQLRSGEFHRDRAASRWEQRASTACRHDTASLHPASPVKNHP